MSTSSPLAPVPARDVETDLLVVGTGTGLFAALAAREAGLDVVVVEKTAHVGGSTALSGGAFWIPGNAILTEQGSSDTVGSARTYLDHLVGDAADPRRYHSYLDHGPAAVDLLRRTCRNRWVWARGYSDYHPDIPGGSAAGRSVESAPFDAAQLGEERARLIPPSLSAPVPMPITSPDYRWMNLMAKAPGKAVPRIVRRLAEGLGGMALGRAYVATGQALQAGIYRALLDRGVTPWTCTDVAELVSDDGRVTGAVLVQQGRRVTVRARRGVVLAAGGFDHDARLRRDEQLEAWQPGWSLGAPGNTGDGLRLGQQVGARLAGLEQAWWFPAVAPVGDEQPGMMLAERSLPGSFIVDGHGRRFVNESTDYMSFGQRVRERELAGDPVGRMWIVFDQQYRNSYVFAGLAFPRMPLPRQWYEAGIAHRGDAEQLATAMGIDPATFTQSLARFNELAGRAHDEDFGRGASAYDRYYGDPTVTPSPNLRPLSGTLYAVEVVLADLGTCGGLAADDLGRVLREDGSVVQGPVRHRQRRRQCLRQPLPGSRRHHWSGAGLRHGGRPPRRRPAARPGLTGPGAGAVQQLAAHSTMGRALAQGSAFGQERTKKPAPAAFPLVGRAFRWLPRLDSNQ
ncbi:FAD-binding protein [Luteococcus peritonei]|uniref:FAD-binding protein n=1 Tax=Luteococcus peritonei TaxID=88874 RepID=A0ABW4RW54_9ACTN